MENKIQRFPVKRFSLEERIKIAEFLKEGMTFIHIASSLSRSINGVSLEVNRNGGKFEYCPYKAHNKIKTSPVLNLKRTVKLFTQEERDEIGKMVMDGYGTMQISRKLDRPSSSISTEVRKIRIKNNLSTRPPRSLNLSSKDDLPVLTLKSLQNQIKNLEFQIEIITDTLKEILHDTSNK